MKKKFAFILMGPAYDPAHQKAVFETELKTTEIYTVQNMGQAEQLAARLAQNGTGAIELCGAFGAVGAARITEVTGGRVAVGYVVHEPVQDPLFAAFFGG